MQVLIIILNEIEYLESVVKLLRETGIRGATVLDGLGSNSKNSQLSAMDKINELVNNENKKTSGAIMMTLPVNHMRGGELERHIIRRDSKKDNQGS
jgi:hypothetical protein